MPECCLGYWKLRGLGQSIRLILEYAGVDYAQRSYEMGPSPKFSRDEWLAEKFRHGLDFPNLPYYCDGTHKITQSHAILKHLGRKHNLVGQTEEELIRIDMTEHEAADLRNATTALAYNPDFEKLRASYITDSLKPKLEGLSKFLGEKDWFAGDKLTYVDFLVYELLDVTCTLSPCTFAPFDNLKSYMKRFEALEPINKYMKSDKFMKSPINAPMAGFGSK